MQETCVQEQRDWLWLVFSTRGMKQSRSRCRYSGRSAGESRNSTGISSAFRIGYDFALDMSNASVSSSCALISTKATKRQRGLQGGYT